jgi:hypothetical protein
VLRAVKSYTRPEFAEFYSLSGRSICIKARDGWVLSLFKNYLAGWSLATFLGESGPPADATITINSDSAAPDSFQGGETFKIATDGYCHTDGQTYLLRYSGSTILVTAEKRAHVEVWIGNTEIARRTGALARLVFNALMAALRRCGLFELHAAGVVAPHKGAGVLFVGPSGSGKSTLTSHLAAAGWQYLSDDSLILYLDGGRVISWGLRRVFALTEATFSRGGVAGLESIETETLSFDPRKRRFEPQSLFPNRFVESCTPGVLFFPSVTEGQSSRTRPLTQKEAMSRLIVMCPWACYDKPVAREHLGVLALLSKQCVAYELNAGNDIFGDVERTASFIKGHLRVEAL